jgi:hypothetical protein
MRKLKLNAEELEVMSFEPAPVRRSGAGTVRGFGQLEPGVPGQTIQMNTEPDWCYAITEPDWCYENTEPGWCQENTEPDWCYDITEPDWCAWPTQQIGCHTSLCINNGLG